MKQFIIGILAVAGLFFGGSSLYAFHIEERAAIASAAHDVDEKAQHLHEWAEGKAHHYDDAEERALRRLHKFAERANHFHGQVESWRSGDSYHLRKDFYKLQESWYRVEDSLNRLHPDNHTYNDFLKARDAMYRLEALSRHTRTLSPYRPRNWWDQFVHIHGPGCGHYYWGGEWRANPPGHYQHYQFDYGD